MYIGCRGSISTGTLNLTPPVSRIPRALKCESRRLQCTSVDQPPVSLVVPGRNCAKTIRACLDAALEIERAQGDGLREIIFVDDGSTDDTAQIVESYPVKLLTGPGGGPGAARNVGWKAAASPWVWFIDSDCVAEPDALARLLRHLEQTDLGRIGRTSDQKSHAGQIGGVGGSYANMYPQSLLACLIHEEIIERHRRMPRHVNFIGGFNVLYRRSALEAVGGFDECRFNGPGSPGAEDAELSYRVHGAGYRLLFEPDSRVAHFHPTRLGRYLRSQRHHGYWRVALHLTHREKAVGDAYSSAIDHVQPVLAVLLLVALPTIAWPRLRWICLTIATLLMCAQIPMTMRLIRRTRRLTFLAFAALSFLRAFWRGIGMLHGLAVSPFQRNH